MYKRQVQNIIITTSAGRTVAIQLCADDGKEWSVYGSDYIGLDKVVDNLQMYATEYGQKFEYVNADRKRLRLFDPVFCFLYAALLNGFTVALCLIEVLLVGIRG